jgi:hypothetical protein
MKRFLEFFIKGDNKQFKRTVDDTKKESNKFASFMEGIGKKLVAALAVGAIIAGFRKLINTMVEAADRIADLADITGMATDQIQEYQFVARMAGVNTEAVTNAAEGLIRKLQNLESEASPVSRGIKELGVNMREANGEIRASGLLMDEIITRLASMDNVVDRNRIGTQVFGGAWKDMAPILSMGADGIDKLRREAHELGVVMDKETIEKTNELRMQKERLRAVGQGLGREIGSLLIPVLNELAEVSLKAARALSGTASAARQVITDKDLSLWQKAAMLMGLGSINAQDRAKVIEWANAKQEALRDTEEESIATTGDLNKVTEQQSGLLIDLKKRLEDATKAREESTDPKFIQAQNKLIHQLREQIAFIEAFTGELKHSIEAIEDIARAYALIDDAPIIFDNIADVAQRSGNQITVLNGKVRELTGTLGLLADNAIWWGEDMKWAGIQAEGSMRDYGKTVIDVTRRNIAAFLAEYVAGIVRSTTSIPFPFNLAAGAVAGGMAAATFNTIIPSFGAGGAAFGPTLALIGEAPGISKSNPEYVGTADQLGLSKGSDDVRFRIEGDIIEGVRRKRKQMEIYF